MKRSKLTKNISSAEAQIARYLDGESSPEEWRAFEKRLEQEPDLARTVEAFAVVGDLLRDTYREEISAVDFSDFWRGVEAGIEALPARAGAVEAAGARPGLWKRVSSWFGVNTWRPVATAAVAAAVVLSFLVPKLWETGGEHDAFVASNDAYIQDGKVIVASPDDVLSDQGGTVAASDATIQTDGVEVSQVSEGASVYLVNGATIIWVDDTGEAEGAAI